TMEITRAGAFAIGGGAALVASTLTTMRLNHTLGATEASNAQCGLAIGSVVVAAMGAGLATTSYPRAGAAMLGAGAGILAGIVTGILGTMMTEPGARR
ncbi:MAG: hypothetical protein JWN41_199, partial [Thermoleophilia bacterium]|nr:hypothetical protein [Thermoleophilia bacterium]